MRRSIFIGGTRIAEYFKLVTDMEVIESLRNLGIEYELSGGEICFLDEELEDTGICIYFNERGDVYKAVVEMKYIGNKEEFKKFMRTLKSKYSFLRDLSSLIVRARDYVWVENIEKNLRGKPIIEHLGEICTFDEDLDAEICFRLGKKYGKDAVMWVKVRTTFIGGRERFKQFIENLRTKYSLPKSIDIRVSTIKGGKLREIKEWYY